MKTKKLTFVESLMLVAGAGIGTGILTIPYAIEKIGIWGTFAALALAYAVSAVMYLIIADLTRNSDKPEDLLGILNQHLFVGKGKKLLSILFCFCLKTLSFIFCAHPTYWWTFWESTTFSPRSFSTCLHPSS